jgi:hypothetical protein
MAGTTGPLREAQSYRVKACFRSFSHFSAVECLRAENLDG